ncbi:Signal recognition particle subunit SRP14 [Wickerhamomyces ciferrii]|uniref:Signal recognition particle subunit SRP14 n=1 Tax=Wickerhamomyces ciferrii (strain ATCC 14091 / BCRC 22168 / CBS 111 / JCM 3599 / NBRC 0793 / NRRL Y-1031 F-60-10) TaxID=1206466 RepID=K0KBB3_WICCF|nr:Signal recognition particle subunit SRP14 [Wickerhamomyces ciferrii]CCH42285.1 Signal recognition particle subunit SRP14 [Wickerhamomyces ciferrii]
MALLTAAEIFEKSHDKRSSVYLTQKRYTEADEVNGPKDAQNEISQFSESTPALSNSNITRSTKNYPILIRITDGNSDKSKKVKISTKVDNENLSKFWKEYTQVIKSGATGLKKKDKSKKRKKSAK